MTKDHAEKVAYVFHGQAHQVDEEKWVVFIEYPDEFAVIGDLGTHYYPSLQAYEDGCIGEFVRHAILNI